jgi:hypothetical protein
MRRFIEINAVECTLSSDATNRISVYTLLVQLLQCLLAINVQRGSLPVKHTVSYRERIINLIKRLSARPQFKQHHADPTRDRRIRISFDSATDTNLTPAPSSNTRIESRSLAD